MIVVSQYADKRLRHPAWGAFRSELPGRSAPSILRARPLSNLARYDGLWIVDEKGTWVYHRAKNVLAKLDCRPQATGAGVVYSPRHELFCVLDGHGCRMQQVWVLRYKPVEE